MSFNKCLTIGTVHLHTHLLIFEHWFYKWKIKINKNKSTHITFTLGQKYSQPIKLNNTIIHSQNIVKYLGLYLEKRLTRATHIKKQKIFP